MMASTLESALNASIVDNLAPTIGAWMLGATLFAVFLALAALASERGLRSTGIPTRLPWVVALLTGIVWPVVAPLVFRYLAARNVRPMIADDSGTLSASTIISQQLPAMSVHWNERLGIALLVLWATASGILLLRLLFAMRAIARVQFNARPTVLDGQSVLVTESLGPAVIGLWQPRVAVPSWFLQLDAPLRALVLRHEREHCRSRDPQLVWLAAISVVLMPWNVAIWWLSRRLRLALEIDCDTRTLSRESGYEQYGKLLLLIAQRQSGYPLAIMLAESTSHLSRRISSMQMIRRVSAVRVIVSAAVAVGAVAVACSPRIATDLTGPKNTARSSLTKTTSPGTVYFEYQVEKPVTGARGSAGPTYPDGLKAKGIEGQVLAQFVVGVDGRAEPATFKDLKPELSNAEFVAAVREALPTMMFEPALVGGKAVKQLVMQPFQFALSRKDATLGKLTPSGTATIRDFKGPSDSRVLELPTNVVRSNQAGSQDQWRAQQAKSSAKGGVLTNTVQPLNATADEKHYEFTVSKAVNQLPGSPSPVYPPALKEQKLDGEVVVQFVIGRDGIPEVSTLKILSSTNPEFTQSVKDALPNMKFEPAVVNGVVVKQLVQQPFQFSISK